MDLALNIRSKANNAVQESKLLLNGDRVFVGRGPECAVLLDGQGISRQHLGMEAEGSALFITDLSSNGSWLNGKRLAQNERSKVATSDVIELPGYEIRISTPSAPAATEIRAVATKAKNEFEPSVPPRTSFVGAFTVLERIVVLLALCSAALFLLYIYS